MLNRNALESIGISSGLIFGNIALMLVLAYTPVAGLLDFVFQWAIVGILFFGALLTIGNSLASSGIEKDDTGLATAGMGLLQFAYGAFGAGLLAGLSLDFQLAAVGITAVATTIIAVLAGLYVFWTDRDLGKFQRYAAYSFGGVLLTGLVGTFFPPLLLGSFLLALLGFMFYLVYEIYQIKTRPSRVYLNAVGIYVAFMGVFIQILQIILRLLSSFEE